MLCEGYSQEMILVDKSTRLRQFRDQTEHTGCFKGDSERAWQCQDRRIGQSCKAESCVGDSFLG